MNISYFIGNGFDINLNLSTSFNTFIKKYYLKQSSENKAVLQFKETIKDTDEELWSRLEEYLGEYTETLKSSSEFISVFDDLQQNLNEYLKIEQSTLNLSDEDKKSIINDFFNPQRYLIPNDRRNLIKFLQSRPNKDFNLTINTFNYTNCIETIFPELKPNINISTKNSLNTISKLLKVNHIHGLIDDFMIFGVNDISQISNMNFHDIDDIKEHLIKPFANDSYDTSKNTSVESNISKADLYCFHGVSLGITDHRWWELIGKELLNGKYMVFHKYFNQKDQFKLNRNKILPIIREEKKRIMEIFKIPEDKRDIIQNQIYIEIGNQTFANNAYDQSS